MHRLVPLGSHLQSLPAGNGKLGVVGFCYGGGMANFLAAWPASEAALKAAGVKYQAFIYPGTQHGFNNDTTPRYNKEAATLAWQRTIDFFNKHLRAS